MIPVFMAPEVADCYQRCADQAKVWASVSMWRVCWPGWCEKLHEVGPGMWASFWGRA